jgi:hypothetical protein
MEDAIIKYWTFTHLVAISPLERRAILMTGTGPMENATIEELQIENHHLREMVVSLSATLLRNLTFDPPRHRRHASSADAEHLVEDAEECFRCARVPGLKKEIAEGLEAAGNELMAKAVEIETVLQREKWKK